MTVGVVGGTLGVVGGELVGRDVLEAIFEHSLEEFTLSVDGSRSTGNIDRYEWDFGDYTGAPRTHSWEGTPHLSPSIAVVDGEIVARNPVNNPAVGHQHANALYWWASGQTMTRVPQGDGWAAQAVAPWSVIAPPPAPVAPGEYWAIRTTVKGPKGKSIRANLSTTAGQSGLTPTINYILTGEEQEIVVPGSPVITAAGQLYWYTYANASPAWTAGETFTMTRFMAVKVSGPGVFPPPYFDGDTPDVSGIYHSWVDEPHASISTRVEGVNVHTNYMPNPSFETGLDGMIVQSSSIARTDFPEARGSGRWALALTTQETTSLYAAYTYTTVDIPSDSGGKWFAYSLLARKSTGPDGIRLFYQLRSGSTVLTSSYGPFNLLTDKYQRFVHVGQIPDGTDNATIWLRTRGATVNDPPPPGITHSDDWMVVIADTQAEAIALASNYFDGDTPDVLFPFTGITQEHTYEEPGEYPVTLTVVSNSGKTASSTQEVTVEAVAPPWFGPVAPTTLEAWPEAYGTTVDSEGRYSLALRTQYSWLHGSGNDVTVVREDATGRTTMATIEEWPTTAPSSDGGFLWYTDAANYVGFVFSGTNIHLRQRFAGVNDSQTIPYDPTRPHRLKITHDVANDQIVLSELVGETVTELRRMARTVPITNATVRFYAGTWGAGVGNFVVSAINTQ